jgi:hypothetical protein
MTRRKRGPLAKEISKLYWRIYRGKGKKGETISNKEFVDSLKELYQQYKGSIPAINQCIGLAIDSHARWMEEEERESIWKLACEVDPKIREAVENWHKKVADKLKHEGIQL